MDKNLPHVVIRTVRRRLQMTQAQLAKRAGMPQSHLAKIETGKVDVQFNTLRKILRAMFCETMILPKFLKSPGTIRELIRSEEKLARRHAPLEMPVHIVDREDPRADLQFWLGKSPEERINAVEFLRRQCFLITGRNTLPRLTHSLQLMERRT